MKLLILFVIFLIDRSIDAQQIDLPIPCKTDETCSIVSNNQKSPTCKDGYCACLNEQQQLKNCSSIQVGSHHEKMKASSFYHLCKLDMDCTFNNSFCNTTINQCDCQKGYVPSMKNQHCLLVARSLSFPCTEDKQCLAFQPNTTCQQQQCVCVTGYHAVDNVCWKMAPFGSPCTKSEECNHVKDAICTNKKICDCTDEAILDSTKRHCIPLPKTIGDHCTSNDQCSRVIQFSICVDQKCQCMEANHFVGEIEKCVVNRAIDEPCKHDYDCYQSDNETNAVQCAGTLCDCAENYLRDGDKCVSAGVPRVGCSFMIILSVIVSSLYLH